MTPKIICAETAEEIEQVRSLFIDYAQTRDVDLCFVNFQQELDSLPGQYAPPSGCLILATVMEHPAGCVALRRLDDSICEMKRLFVRPQFRGQRLGQTLVQSFLDQARGLGYRTIRLDTFPSKMAAAVALYRACGFRTIPPYWDNPFPGVEYMQLDLGQSEG